MDDKTGALNRLKAEMDEAEKVDMSSVKIGDIIYVSLDEGDGLVLKEGYKERVMQFLKETDVFDNATKRRYGIIR